MTINKFGHWLVPHDFDPDDYVGYIYIIKNNINNKQYVGRKQFKSLRRLKPLKGRVNKRHRYSDSDWRGYCGSSKSLLNDINNSGWGNFTFTIIQLCKNKSQMSYFEAYYMFQYEVLTKCNSKGERMFYNQNIPKVPCPPKL